MLLLFETPAGFAIFKVLDEAKLRSCDDLFRDFETPEGASKVVKLKHFSKFADMTDALAATTAAVEGKLSKGLRKVLKKAFSSEVQEQLAVADSKLGSAIKEKLNIGCVHDSSIAELMRCVRSQFNNLVSATPVAKKVKKEKKLEQLDESVPVVSPAVSKKVKKEKKDEEQLDESLAEASPTKKVKKEKKRKHPDLEDETLPETSPSPVKKKKKKSLA